MYLHCMYIHLIQKTITKGFKKHKKSIKQISERYFFIFNLLIINYLGLILSFKIPLQISFTMAGPS